MSGKWTVVPERGGVREMVCAAEVRYLKEKEDDRCHPPLNLFFESCNLLKAAIYSAGTTAVGSVATAVESAATAVVSASVAHSAAGSAVSTLLVSSMATFPSASQT